jgi:hypothetical protein
MNAEVLGKKSMLVLGAIHFNGAVFSIFLLNPLKLQVIYF